MTSSNARIIAEERKDIVMTGRSRKNSLAAQKIAGTVMLAVISAAVAVGGEFSAAVVIVPMALAAVFSKEKLMDFGIFTRKN